jgi:hypothetical protein
MKKENARGFPLMFFLSVLLAFFQSYVENDIRKNKIIVAPTIGFFEALALNLG